MWDIPPRGSHRFDCEFTCLPFVRTWIKKYVGEFKQTFSFLFLLLKWIVLEVAASVESINKCFIYLFISVDLYQSIFSIFPT